VFMRIVYHAENIIDAQLAKDVLESESIPAFVSGAYLTGAMGQLPARDFITVMVPNMAVEQAQRILREAFPDRPPRAEWQTRTVPA